MRFGHHEAQPERSRRRQGFRPGGERLERRELLAIDLANVAGGDTTSVPGPYGVLEGGTTTGGGTGFSVAEVGDVNGDGFDDFVVGQPSFIRSNTGIALGAGGFSQAFLIFGSDQVTAQTFDWRTLTAQQRIGSLAALGNAQQTNPVNGAPGFAFDGLTFTASQNPSGGLGASVAAVGDVNGDGFADILIGAPGSNDASGLPTAAGRAYLIYGGTQLNRQNKLVDLDNPTANSDLNILTFVNNAPNAATGRAVASAGDIIPDGSPDIAIGAPNASINGLGGSGAVYVISGSALRPARSETIALQFTGQGGGTNVPGLIFTGGASGDAAGFSIAPGGNFAGATVNAQAQSTLLIGSPQFNLGPGQVSVVYATTNLASQPAVVNGVSSIILSRIGAAVNGVSGAIFTGEAVGDQTGFSVSTAGDFDADGVGDILIGSPGFNAAAGRVNLIYGRRASSASGAITGTVALTGLPAGINGVEFDGTSAGALAGFSVTAVGRINNDTINEVLIGSPGFNNSQGVAYLIPGNPDLQGVFNLATTEASPIQGLIIGLSQPAGTFNYLGASVSGIIGTNGQNRTADADTAGDFIIGAPGFPLNGATSAGGVYMLEGAFIPLPNVVSTAITSPIGVGSATAPFAINATAPADLQIFILSAGSNTPGFQPFRDIDPTTLTVNGVALPDPGTFTQEADLDGDGIPDASFIFTPRSALNLPNGTVTFTVSGRTNSTSPFPNRRYTGTAPVTVSGGSGGGGTGGLPSERNVAFANLGANNQANLTFGERLVPTNAILGRLNYKPLRPFQAHKQFLPTNGFGLRTHLYYFPNQKKTIKVGGGNLTGNNAGGTFTLSRSVFTRGKFPARTFTGHIHHKGPHIP